MVNYIVSGCPRSGTSMVMRILERSGMPIAKDEKRKADNDNKYGYFEIDNIISMIEKNPEIVYQFEDKILKVTHFGLKFIPKGSYKIIYIERDIEEVLNSMEKMMGKKDDNREETKNAFIRLNEKIKNMMGNRDDIEYIIISHRKLITHPETEIEKIIRFFNIDSGRKEKMIEAIDTSLYRNRNS